MFRRKFFAMAALALFTPATVLAASTDAAPASSDPGADKLNDQQRLHSLEERVKQLESAPPVAPTSAANSFNPAILLILSGLYANLSQDPANYRITGFPLPSGVDAGPGQRGFSLAESELGIYANIDPYFYGGLNYSMHPDDTASVEEAFVQTIALPNGFTVKAGRFFSGIGYLNAQHAHVWDFVDAPLVYQAFLGTQFGDDALQVKWLAPTELFLELGAELGRGRPFPGSDRDKNGSGAGTVFVHVGGDVGASHSWRAGLSILESSPRNREFSETDLTGNDITNAFSGDGRLWIADFVWKYAPNGNPVRTNFKLQAEYLRREEDGDLTYDTTGVASTAAYDARQSGWYLQGIYQFMPYWRVGLRAEQLDHGTVDYGSNNANLPRSGFNPSKHSVMVDFNPSEFSRIRLQFARDQSRQDVTDNQWFVQYQMSLGAHGAHQY
ncbi:hypothetical protein SCL_2099 [Sulfuricaulis limicola]|uniref:Zinc-regulated TonB-dependent outer membrane receptor n=1 Tax=Sulfuricaulis limicola TaxID=1620215 RepID=A0A1B4XHV3_9GAMM|nr:hypothetical protein [Sulfuricaulis limicola]BAV34388.1 hypothetical protein SCL_2099 [Sulfuricaulis limicola]